MAELSQLDKTVFTWLNSGCESPFLDRIVPWISHLGDAVVTWFWIALIGLLMAGQLAESGRAGQGGGHMVRWGEWLLCSAFMPR